MTKISAILQAKTHNPALVISLILSIAAFFGILVLVYIGAWLILGEGSNSKLYHDSTVVVVSSITLLIVNFILFLIGRWMFRKGKMGQAKSMAISALVVLLLYGSVVVSNTLSTPNVI